MKCAEYIAWFGEERVPQSILVKRWEEKEPLGQTLVAGNMLLMFLSSFFPVAQQSPVSQGLLIHEVSSPQNDAPQSLGLFWTGDQLVAQTSTW